MALLTIDPKWWILSPNNQYPNKKLQHIELKVGVVQVIDLHFEAKTSTESEFYARHIVSFV